ncbi:MAG: apolipoprotein N-acyltransferase [Elusimicrobiales bacterium]
MQPKVGRLYALAALSGLLLAASFAPLRLGALAWIALAPLFYAVTRAAGGPQAFALGGVAGLVFYPLALHWMADTVHYLAVPFWLIFSLWTALHAALLRGLWRRTGEYGAGAGRPLLWAAAAGLTWAGIEYFRSELWALECPWLALGYSQTFSPEFFQSLSLWGVYGLSALIVSANAAWALLPHRRLLWRPAVAAGLALTLTWGWGSRRLASFPADAGRAAKVALVQAERADIKTLAKLSLTPEAAGADLLVWPECSVYMPSEQSPAYVSLLRKELRRSGAEAVIGVCVDEDRARGIKRGNYTLHLAPRGGPVLGLYHKMHPVQFVETGLPRNKAPVPVDTPLGRLGPQICYDLAFENGTRRLAAAGAEILITPTLDPLDWSLLQHEQHSDMSAARAVESGLWLVRAASSGRSQVIDSLGRERASLAGGREGVLAAQARLAPGGTVYTRFGWTLGPAALLFTLWAALVIRRKVR